ALVRQRMTPTSDKSLAGEHRCFCALLEKHRDLFDSEVHYRFARDWLTLKYHWLGGHRLRVAAGLVRLGLAHPLGTMQRLVQAVPNLGINRAFRRFHAVSRP